MRSNQDTTDLMKEAEDAQRKRGYAIAITLLLITGAVGAVMYYSKVLFSNGSHGTTVAGHEDFSTQSVGAASHGHHHGLSAGDIQILAMSLVTLAAVVGIIYLFYKEYKAATKPALFKATPMQPLLPNNNNANASVAAHA